MAIVKKAVEMMLRYKSSLIFCIILWMEIVACGVGGGMVYAQPAKPPAGDEPLNITASRLEADHEKRVITFSGQVVARQGEVILYADDLKIYYEAKKEPKKEAGANVGNTGAKETQSPLESVGIDKITQIEALGQVRLVQNDKVISGTKATYYKPQEKIVLLGNPQLWRGESSLKGEKITFYLKENRAVVEGAPKKRVQATIFPTAKSQGFLKNNRPEQ